MVHSRSDLGSAVLKRPPAGAGPLTGGQPSKKDEMVISEPSSPIVSSSPASACEIDELASPTKASSCNSEEEVACTVASMAFTFACGYIALFAASIAFAACSARSSVLSAAAFAAASTIFDAPRCCFDFSCFFVNLY